MRQLFIDNLCELAKKNSNIWLLTADLGYSFLEKFSNLFPQRFVNVGVAEQNMVGIASGLALTGKKVFIYSIINFLTLRCFEQIRNDIAYHNLDVTLVGIGGGFSYGAAGYTHHAVEDINVLGSLSNIKIFVPYLPQSIKLVMDKIMHSSYPSYLRLDKVKASDMCCNIIKNNLDMAIVSEGDRGLIISYGAIVSSILQCDCIINHNVKVVSLQCLNPLNKDKLKEISKEIQKILIVEEHVESLISFKLQQIFHQENPHIIINKLFIKKPYFNLCGDREFLKNENQLSSSFLNNYFENFFGL